MAQKVSDVMTRNPMTVDARQTVEDAARLMKQGDTGAIVITDDGRVAGIVTDRDIAVRVVAEGKSPSTTVMEACSGGVESIAPDYTVDKAVQLMRSKAIRRLPVVEDGHAVGIVSIGDLAIERDSDSALADISAASGNS